MEVEEFIRGFESLDPEEQKRVLLALGPQFCTVMLGDHQMMQRMMSWCSARITSAEMQDMMANFMK
ncbi:MAG: hypothetical protein ONB05_02905 [candidate division KSB1 bacterium]|nr:hypothetical protein [candidate division KSB1 bacterium]